MSEKMEPCPFCGGEATLCKLDGGWAVMCDVCDTRNGECGDNYRHAIAAWNTRAPAQAERETAELKAEVERLRALTKENADETRS